MQAMPSAARRQPLPFIFNGRGGEYFKIWIVNIFLTILTLGIYSAWAKVRRNRYFYGNTRLGDASFEYLADPRVILRGRLIAFAVFTGYSAVNNFWPLAGGLFSLAFAGLVPWLVVRSLAFRARNTSFRNIRFDFKGKYGEAARAFLWMPMLIPFTLGLIYPYIVRAQKDMTVRHTAYGTTPFAFDARTRDFYEVFLPALLLLIGGGLLVYGLWRFSALLAVLVGALSYLLIHSYLSAHLSNLVYNHSHVGPHRLRSNLRARELAMLHLTNLAGIAVTLGFFIPWAKVRLAKYHADHLQFLAAGGLDTFAAGEAKKVGSAGEEIGEMFDLAIGA